MRHVTVIGGGYAGVLAAKAAIEEGATATIVDRTGRHDLLTRLAAVAAGAQAQGDAWAPLEDVTDAHVVMGDAVGVDADGDRVHLADGGAVETDAVVIATGAEPVWPDIPGLRDHTLPLRTAGDALRIRAALARELRRLVVVGGGPTGVQLVGEARRAHPDLPVTLVEQRDEVLGDFPPPLRRHATALLTDAGADLRLSAGVASVAADGVTLDDGTELPGTTVWAGGFTARPGRLLDVAVVTDHGRAQVDACLRVEGADAVFMAGDVGAMPDGRGGVLPMSAQVAVQAGRAAGRNAARAVLGMAPRPVHLDDLGWVVAMGGGRGVAELAGVKLADPASDRLVGPLHEVIDLRHLAMLGGLRTVRRFRRGRHRPPATAIANVRRGHPRPRAASLS